MEKCDAAPKLSKPIKPKNLIDTEVLQAIEGDFDANDRILCCFLMLSNYSYGYQSITPVIEQQSNVLSFIHDQGITNWQEKLLGSIYLLQNWEIFLKLNVSIQEVQTYFLNDLKLIPGINKYARAFYMLFENLSRKDAEKLLEKVYEQIPKPTQSLAEYNLLEIHLLWWINKGFVRIVQDKWNLSRLLSVLKMLNLTVNKGYDILEEYNAEDRNNGPCCYDNQTNSIKPITISSMTDNHIASKYIGRYVVNNGLVIVFNQMKFDGSVLYEYRHGSQQDSINIVRTFKKLFEFDSKVFENLSRARIYSELDNLNSYGKKYDCIVVFMLSHGTCGNVIASDCLECPISQLKSKLCSDAFLGKPKILIIQACQKQALTTDSPKEAKNDLNKYRDLLVCYSTIPGEPSVRDSQNGTWFIRILCEVVEKLGQIGKSFEECIKGVHGRFTSMQAVIDGKILQQVPQMESTLTKELTFPGRTVL